MDFSPLIAGVACLAIGVVLIVLGWPRGGVNPRFLQFRAAVVVYPPIVLVFLTAGAAQLLTALF
ncbi:MAG TPA: hypothetical protein VFA57_10745 [Pseudolabrys sp.]|jgi:hypothetical protein|nr:hypothetical protein [Pseudolabrys sp.]